MIFKNQTYKYIRSWNIGHYRIISATACVHILFINNYRMVHNVPCGSNLTRIYKAGCHTAALTGCGDRESADGGAAKECENEWELAIISTLTADGRRLKLAAKCFTAKGAKIAKTMLP